MAKMTSTLVIGDAHSDPRYSNERFDALGNFICERQPECIVQMGDFISLDSITFHTKGKLLLREGMRLKDDLDAAKDAYERFMAPIREEQKKASIWKKRKYQPIGKWLEGNHENRSHRVIMEQPEFQGFVPETDFVDAAKDGWDIVPFKKYVYIRGVGFTHIPMNKRNSSQAISGEYVANRAAELHSTPIVFGHTHRLLIHDKARKGPGLGNVNYAVNVGWFGDYVPDYIDGDSGDCLDWWAGLVVLHHYNDTGGFDIETISMERLKADYL